MIGLSCEGDFRSRPDRRRQDDVVRSSAPTSFIVTSDFGIDPHDRSTVSFNWSPVVRLEKPAYGAERPWACGGLRGSRFTVLKATRSVNALGIGTPARAGLILMAGAVESCNLLLIVVGNVMVALGRASATRLRDLVVSEAPPEWGWRARLQRNHRQLEHRRIAPPSRLQCSLVTSLGADAKRHSAAIWGEVAAGSMLEAAFRRVSAVAPHRCQQRESPTRAQRRSRCRRALQSCRARDHVGHDISTP